MKGISGLRVLLVHDLLDDLGHRLVVDLVDLDAGLLHVVEGLLFHLGPQAPLLGLRRLGLLHDQVLIFLGERAPGALREHQDLRNDQVARHRVVLRIAIVLTRRVARLVVLRAVDDAGLHGVDELVEAHRDAVAAERVHGVDEDRVAHHADLQTLEVVHRLDRLLAVVDVADAAAHPAQADQVRGRMIGELLEHLVADRAGHDLGHVVRVAEHERQVEGVELGHQRSHRAEADARDLQRADLGLLDHLLLAAELHRGEHLDADAAVGGLLEPLAHAHHGLDRRIAERVHVGGLEHQFRLGLRCAEAEACRCQRRHGAASEKLASVH